MILINYIIAYNRDRSDCSHVSFVSWLVYILFIPFNTLTITRYRTLIHYNSLFNLRIYWMQHKNIVQCIRCLLVSKNSYLYTQKDNLNKKTSLNVFSIFFLNTVYRHIHHNEVDKIVIQCNVPLHLVSYQSSKEEETKH